MAKHHFIPVQVTDQVNQYIKRITPGKGDLKGDAHVTHNESENSFNDAARNIFNGMSKHASKLPIGQVKFDNGNDVLDLIKQIDPNNSSGAVQPSVDIMKKLLKETDPLKTLQGMLGSQMYGIMNQVMGLINQKGGGGNNGGVKPGDPCLLADGTQGTLQTDINTGVLGCFKPTQLTITIRPRVTPPVSGPAGG